MPRPNRAQQIERQGEHHDTGRNRNQHASEAQRRRGESNDLPAGHQIERASKPRQREGTTHRGQHVDSTKGAAREVKGGAQSVAGQADEEALPERGEQGQQEPADQPAGIFTQEIEGIASVNEHGPAAA
jgi:hypothetical protein